MTYHPITDHPAFAKRVTELTATAYHWLERNAIGRARMAKLVDVPANRLAYRNNARLTAYQLTVEEQQRLLENLRNEATVLLQVNRHVTPAQIIHCLSK